MIEEIADRIGHAGGGGDSDHPAAGRTELTGDQAGTAAVKKAQVKVRVVRRDGQSPCPAERKQEHLSGVTGKRRWFFSVIVCTFDSQGRIIWVEKEIAGQVGKGRLHGKIKRDFAVGVRVDKLRRFVAGVIVQIAREGDLPETPGIGKLQSVVEKFFEIHNNLRFWAARREEFSVNF